MNKQCKIKEIIVVEGKHDTQRLKQFFDCDTIETNGLQLSENTLKSIELAAKQRGIIVFTDPDHPGENIRRKIQMRIGECKHAWVDKAKAKTDKKVGIEHALYNDLRVALEGASVFETVNKDIYSNDDMIEFGFCGRKDSKCRRAYICDNIQMGRCNAKTFLKRLNMMQISKGKIIKLLEKTDVE